MFLLNYLLVFSVYFYSNLYGHNTIYLHKSYEVNKVERQVRTAKIEQLKNNSLLSQNASKKTAYAAPTKCHK